MSQVRINACADRTSLDIALAQFIAHAVSEAITIRGHAAIALSGGRTPLGMLSLLGAFHLPWENVTITLVDERWVNEDHPDSNAGMIRKILLQGAAQAAKFLPLKNTAPTPHIGQPECEANLSALPAKLDLVILGMGNDGHTASLFPLAPELEEAMHSHQRCVATSPQTAPHLRITLTAPYIAQSREIVLHLTGADKKQILERLLAKDASLPLAPVRRVFDLIRTEKYVFWAE